jgi:Fe-Mn family superoxide dismutase
VAHEELSNHWITLHEVGNVAGFLPMLVMDVWASGAAPGSLAS